MADDLLAAMAAPPKRRLPNLRPPAEPAPEPEAPAAPAEPKRQRARKPAAKKAAGRPATGRTSKGIGLPGPLVGRMQKRCQAEGLAYGDYLMAALDRQWEALEQAYPPLPALRPELPPLQRPPRRLVPGGRQPVNFRLNEEQTAALDARREALAVMSRSEFVTTIIELDLASSSPVDNHGSSGMIVT